MRGTVLLSRKISIVPVLHEADPQLKLSTSVTRTTEATDRQGHNRMNRENRASSTICSWFFKAEWTGAMFTLA